MPRSIFLIFLAVGVAITGGSSFYYAMAWSWSLEGRGWPTALGTIRAVDVREHVGRSNDGHATYTFYPRLSYAYRVGDRSLNGERIWLTGNQYYNRRDDADAFVQGYAIGQSVPVLYDPQDPGQAALLNPVPPWQILLLTAVGLIWIGLAVGFRLADLGVRRRFGRCRKCGARLAFDDYASIRDAVPAAGVALAPSPEGLPCPHCGQPAPLDSWGNRPGTIAFLVLFAAIWVVVIYAMFLA